MANMSYCRFENTSSDLADCFAALERLIDGDEDALSEYELRGAKNLAQYCLKVVTTLAEYEGVEVEDMDEEEIRGVVARLNEEAGRR